jgi:glycosyltransferase involved in cell wall biosynthesis
LKNSGSSAWIIEFKRSFFVVLQERNQMTSIDLIEPFRQGAMVQFAHKLGNAFMETMDVSRVVGSTDFELASLPRRYEFIEGFDIPRDDKVGGGASRSLVAKAKREAVKIRVLTRFLGQYSRAINGVIQRQSDYALMATIFRYPRMTTYLRRLRNAGVRPMQICHEYQMREERKSLQARITHRMSLSAYEHFHAIFFISESQRSGFAEMFPHIDKNRLFVIPCGNAEIFDEMKTTQTTAQVAARYGLKPGVPTVMFFGRIRAEKGVEDLIDAFAQVRQSRPQRVQLMLAGHAPPSFHDRLTKQIEAAGVADDVVVYPEYVASEDVWPLHLAADVTVFPYRSSSQSAAVQTAMATERPIIVTDVGGLAETIRHEVSGLVVPSCTGKPLVDSLVSSIHRLLDHPELASQWGAEAGHLSRTVYAWETIARQMTDAAQSLPSLPPLH